MAAREKEEVDPNPTWSLIPRPETLDTKTYTLTKWGEEAVVAAWQKTEVDPKPSSVISDP